MVSVALQHSATGITRSIPPPRHVLPVWSPLMIWKWSRSILKGKDKEKSEAKRKKKKDK